MNGPFIIDRVAPTNLPVVLITSVLSTCYTTALLRAWARARILRKVGWDDWAMLVALLLFTAYCAGFLMTHLIVTGKSSLTVSELENSIIWLLVSESFYILTMMVIKISLGIFLLRIMINRWEKRIVYAAVALSTLFSTAFFFFAVFQCGPVSTPLEFWKKRALNQCVSKSQALGMNYAHAAITTVTDWTFAVLPIAMLSQSRMVRREKLTVGLILLMGATGGIASMVRFKFIPKIAETSTAFFGNSLHLGLWSTIELAMGIIAGCLATLRPLFRGAIQTARTFRTGSQGSRYDPTIRYHTPTGVDQYGRRSSTPGSLFEVDKLWDNPNHGSSASTWLLAEKWRHGQLESPSPSSHRAYWDVEASPTSSPYWEKISFGALPPLPRAVMKRGIRPDGRVTQVELRPMDWKRRGSSPD